MSFTAEVHGFIRHINGLIVQLTDASGAVYRTLEGLAPRARRARSSGCLQGLGRARRQRHVAGRTQHGIRWPVRHVRPRKDTEPALALRQLVCAPPMAQHPHEERHALALLSRGGTYTSSFGHGRASATANSRPPFPVKYNIALEYPGLFNRRRRHGRVRRSRWTT